MTRTNNLPTITPEQRAEMSEKSKQSRLAKKLFAEENLKLDYADDNYWTDLSKQMGIRLPVRTIPASETKYAKRILTKFDIDPKVYAESCGIKNLRELADMNPEFTARAFCGILLEWINDQQNTAQECN